MSTANNPPGAPGSTSQPPAEQAVAAGTPPQTLPAAAAEGAEGVAKTDAHEEELIGSWLASNLGKAEGPYLFLVVVLAFLLGSFAAANSDAWMYLATGRLLAEGNYQFGVDPFCYSTEGVSWINHSWLSSWIAYQLYGEGGTLLVVVKALVGAAVALLLLLLAPPSPYRWVSILCVLLVALAVSSRFLLQPVVISVLFLAITVFLLHRSGVLAGPDEAARPALLWILPPLFALWVNLDSWFVLGPLTLFVCLALVALDKSPRVPLAKLATVFAVALVACLANPYHFHGVFTLPPELGYFLLKMGSFWPDSLVAGGRALVEFQSLEPNFVHTLSPLSHVYLTQSFLGLNAAGVAFFVLILAVLLSFAALFLARKQPEAPRLSPLRTGLALLFMVLALLHVRLVPFFAVVGGAVAILNWQEYLAWRGSQSAAKAEEQNLWANLARLATGFLLFGLFFLAWPGWLNHPWGDFASPRRVAWSLDAEPALKNAAEYLGQMHQERKLNRGFNLSPDLGNYAAWFAPGVKHFFDYRFQLFGDIVTELNNVRRSLVEETADPLNLNKKASRAWAPVFSKYGIDHVVGNLEKSRTNLTSRLLTVSFLGSKNFEPVYADGRSAVLVWKAAANPALESLAGAWRRQAFGVNTSAAAPGQQELMPLEEDPGFWKLYLFGQKRSSPETQKAEAFLEYYRFRSGDMRWRGNYLFARLVTVPLLSAGLATGPFVQDPLVYHPALTASKVVQGTFGQDVGPPEALVLALRALRFAQAHDPQDPSCYRALASAAEVAMNQENHWAGFTARNSRTDIRRLQFVGALKQYLLLKPQDYDMQWTLGNYYLNNLNYVDLGLEHLENALAGFETLGSTQKEFVQEKLNRGKYVDHVRKDVKQRLAEFERGTTREGDLRKADLAVGRFGLAQKARQILDSVKPASLNDDEKREVVKRRIDLALNTGSLWEVAKALPEFRPTDKNAPLLPNEYWQRHFLLNAAIGDNRQADEALVELEKMDAGFQSGLTGSIAQNLYAHSTGSPVPEALWRWSMISYPFQIQLLAGVVLDRAERKCLRGLLALEMGQTQEAREYLEASLKIANPRMPFHDRKIAERYLQLLRGER